MNATEMIGEYKNYLALIKGRANLTVSAYVADAEQLLQSAKVDSWSEFTEEMAGAYLSNIKAEWRDTSVQRKVYALRGFFKFLRKKGATTLDPFAEVEMRIARRALPKTLTIEEMNRLLYRIREPLPALLGVPTEDVFLTIRDRALLEVLYSAALRVSELVGLDWEHIDWNKRECKVIGKGNKERVCPVGQKALEALLEYSRHYEHKWERKPEGPAPVFLSQWNKRINQRNIPRTIRKWCQAAGVKRVNPHAFRHSAATHMLENGADIRVIQRLLGHASIQTTEIYTHVAIRQVKTVHANTHPRA